MTDERLDPQFPPRPGDEEEDVVDAILMDDPESMGDPPPEDAYDAAEADTVPISTPMQARLTERQIQAVQLRKAGYSYQEIADTLGYGSRGAAFNGVKAALQRWGAEAVDELRMLELTRLDEMTKRIWPQILGRSAQGKPGDADYVPGREPDKDAMHLYLKISERRARLLGLDSPQQVDLSFNQQGERPEDKRVEDVREYVDLISRITGPAGPLSPPDAGGGGGSETADDPVLPSHPDGEAE